MIGGRKHAGLADRKIVDAAFYDAEVQRVLPNFDGDIATAQAWAATNYIRAAGVAVTEEDWERHAAWRSQNPDPAPAAPTPAKPRQRPQEPAAVSPRGVGKGGWAFDNLPLEVLAAMPKRARMGYWILVEMAKANGSLFCSGLFMARCLSKHPEPHHTIGERVLTLHLKAGVLRLDKAGRKGRGNTNVASSYTLLRASEVDTAKALEVYREHRKAAKAKVEGLKG